MTRRPSVSDRLSDPTAAPIAPPPVRPSLSAFLDDPIGLPLPFSIARTRDDGSVPAALVAPCLAEPMRGLGFTDASPADSVALAALDLLRGALGDLAEDVVEHAEQVDRLAAAARATQAAYARHRLAEVDAEPDDERAAVHRAAARARGARRAPLTVDVGSGRTVEVARSSYARAQERAAALAGEAGLRRADGTWQHTDRRLRSFVYVLDRTVAALSFSPRASRALAVALRPHLRPAPGAAPSTSSSPTGRDDAAAVAWLLDTFEPGAWVAAPALRDAYTDAGRPGGLDVNGTRPGSLTAAALTVSTARTRRGVRGFTIHDDE